MSDYKPSNLAEAKILLLEAIGKIDAENPVGAGWRIADAAEILKNYCDQHGETAPGVHFATGRGNKFTAVAP